MSPAGYTYPTPAMQAEYIAASRGGKGNSTQLDVPGLVAVPAAMGGWRGLKQWLAISILGADAKSVLFAPQQPLQPLAQPIEAGAVGRPWDYPMGWNTRVTPRSGDQITFAMLKNLARYDVMRIILEHVKEEVCAQQWSVGPKDKKAARDKRSDDLQLFLERPDKDHSFGDWLKMILDQMLVYDAPAVWLRPTRGGDLYGLEIIDGSLIQPKIMADGRLPPPEIGPAYQQVLKGLPAVDYVRPVRKGQPVPIDPNGQPFPELLYKPRTPRVDSPFGFGPVEQMIVTIQIGLGREDYLKSYYTDGSAPDTIFGVPPEWNADQIAKFQANFNAILAGNLQARRQVQFVPGGFTPYDIKEKALTDATDEHLIRVLCFALGISPMPFVKMMNRATGEQHAEQQRSEGTEPFMRWVRDLLNYVIDFKFDPDIEFRWEREDATDPLEQAQVDRILVETKQYHPDELRVKRGDDVMPADLRAQMDDPKFTTSKAGFGDGFGGQGDNNPAPGVAGKLGKAYPITSRRAAIARVY